MKSPTRAGVFPAIQSRLFCADFSTFSGIDVNPWDTLHAPQLIFAFTTSAKDFNSSDFTARSGKITMKGNSCGYGQFANPFSSPVALTTLHRSGIMRATIFTGFHRELFVYAGVQPHVQSEPITRSVPKHPNGAGRCGISAGGGVAGPGADR